MVMFYFSGTGNSRFIAGSFAASAELFCKNMNSRCCSIEENVDFIQLIASEEIIGFCYPVYGSRVPRIMREFSLKHIECFKNKKVIIFCTQLIFSGDGARAFTDIFPRNYFDVIYAEHFLMPNNVCNLFFLPLASNKKVRKYIVKAEQKMETVCKNITNGIVIKKGFNVISRVLGLMQGVFIPLIEKSSLDSVVIHNNCTQCKLCVSICPMKNLVFHNNRIMQKSNCTICYRCINKCPQKAISLFFKGRVKTQYKGLY